MLWVKFCLSRRRRKHTRKLFWMLVFFISVQGFGLKNSRFPPCSTAGSSRVDFLRCAHLHARMMCRTCWDELASPDFIWLGTVWIIFLLSYLECSPTICDSSQMSGRWIAAHFWAILQFCCKNILQRSLCGRPLVAVSPLNAVMARRFSSTSPDAWHKSSWFWTHKNSILQLHARLVQFPQSNERLAAMC